MKKWILTAALASLTLFAKAQDNMNSKNGTPILPEAGNWSIAFDASPWLHYAGNLLSSAGTNNANAAYLVPNTLVGKYMIDGSTAYRCMLRIGYNMHSQDSLVPNGSGGTYTNTYKNSSMNITLGAGKQWYRGKGRLKGYYGGMAMLTFGSPNSNTVTYGAPTSAMPRVTEMSAGSTFGIGVRGFVGAEYFFAPKMSIGAEYGWGIMYNMQGQGKMTTESTAGTTTTNTGGNSSFNIDVDNFQGAIMLSLYF